MYSQSKEVMIIRSEINKQKQVKNKTGKINKIKSQYFKKVGKIIKHLAKPEKRKKRVDAKN